MNHDFVIDTIIKVTENISKPSNKLIINKQQSIGIRYVKLPEDENFNGKPMTQQLEIKSKILNQFHDTLKQIA